MPLAFLRKTDRPPQNQTYRAHELVDTCEAFFCLDATLELKLFALFVPGLEPFVELAHEVGSNLVVNYTVEAATAILGRISNVDTTFASLRIVGHTRRCHLILFELDR